jgi:hypothetical protein
MFLFLYQYLFEFLIKNACHSVNSAEVPACPLQQFNRVSLQAIPARNPLLHLPKTCG